MLIKKKISTKTFFYILFVILIILVIGNTVYHRQVSSIPESNSKQKNKLDTDSEFNQQEKEEIPFLIPPIVSTLGCENCMNKKPDGTIMKKESEITKKKQKVKELYKFFIIRHGEAYHNIDLCENHPDPKLTEKGIEQVKRIKDNPVLKTREDDPDVIFLSPLSRTIETTYYAFEYLIKNEQSKTSFILNEFLQEDEAGNNECDTGSSAELLEGKYPFFDYSILRDQWFIPNENKTERRKKFKKFLRDYLIDKPETNYGVIVAHHGTIMGLLEKSWTPLGNAKVLDCMFFVEKEKFYCEKF